MKPQATDHGLLMSGPLATAAYRGIKTQTRRPVKPQPTRPPSLADDCEWSSPYGCVGDRIYVRETWRTHEREDGLDGILFPDGTFRPIENTKEASDAWLWVHDTPANRGTNWRPSIHMPKWAARTWGTVTEVRAQRLWNITEDDAIAEGVESALVKYSGIGSDQRIIGTSDTFGDHPYRASFAVLWDELYADVGLRWVDNPWVWVVTWSRIDK